MMWRGVKGVEMVMDGVVTKFSEVIIEDSGELKVLSSTGELCTGLFVSCIG